MLVHNDCSVGGLNNFKNGELFESSFKLTDGTEVQALAEVSIEGSTLKLNNVVVYSNVGDIPNGVGVVTLKNWMKDVKTQAKQSGFTTLQIVGIRVPGSSASNVGYEVNMIFNLK